MMKESSDVSQHLQLSDTEKVYLVNLPLLFFIHTFSEDCELQLRLKLEIRFVLIQPLYTSYWPEMSS